MEKELEKLLNKHKDSVLSLIPFLVEKEETKPIVINIYLGGDK